MGQKRDKGEKKGLNPAFSSTPARFRQPRGGLPSLRHRGKEERQGRFPPGRGCAGGETRRPDNGGQGETGKKKKKRPHPHTPRDGNTPTPPRKTACHRKKGKEKKEPHRVVNNGFSNNLKCNLQLQAASPNHTSHRQERGEERRAKEEKPKKMLHIKKRRYVLHCLRSSSSPPRKGDVPPHLHRPPGSVACLARASQHPVSKRRFLQVVIVKRTGG